MTFIEKLLLQLIKIPSPSGKEREVGEFIIGQLKGFKVKKQPVSKDRFNIIATKGSSKKWLVAHMDTVVGQPPLRITPTRIYGRGACDNKQSIAASIIVGNQLNDINLLFTVGEEDNFIGARTAQKSGIKGDLIIVQEPTNFQIRTGQRGVITFVVETKGKKQHSSLDNPNSAIHKLVSVLNDLSKLHWTAFNTGLISGGSAENIVADKADAIIVVRPKNNKEHTWILKELSKIETKEIKITIKNNVKPSISSLKFPENIAKGFSEMAFFKNSIEFGAGTSKVSHTDEEYIAKKDLNILPNRLIELLERYKD